MFRHNALAGLATAGLALAAALPASAQDIKIGQTMPYSGPASAYSVIGKTESAYFQMINDQGGVNGHKINLISVDDGYVPVKTVEQVRDLAENQHVLFFFNTLGTPQNTAIRKYLNDHKIPQLFVASGADKWGDYEHFPWTMGYQPSYQVEARIYAKYILQNKPDAKIALLYQNDDFGKDYLVGLKDGLGAKAAKMLVSTQTYETSEPTVDSQIVSLQGSGADTLVVAAIPKFAAQSIRKVAQLGWHPLFLMTNVSISMSSVLKPAGLEASKGIITGTYGKDPTDPSFKNDADMKEYLTWVKKWDPSADPIDINAVYGYGLSHVMVQVLKQCGKDFSRENIMKQAANLNMSVPMLLPGIKVSTSPTDFHPIKQMQLEKFNGTTWVRFGEVISGAGS
ncbi:MAG TPA: ABC transporter substrate-binding protein [Stellaceae bacterium]|jgi:branched-chain amino acid transport system substrate-binding protein|nr:ABC transporter substrate-binding protein [Stellaceae bacterium]